jgi:N-acetylglutamate synthase-like GNAT family acetyltransferase
MTAQKLSSMQLELLKVYAMEPSEEDLFAVKELLANYFSNKILIQVNQSVVENNITEDDLKNWLNESK